MKKQNESRFSLCFAQVTTGFSMSTIASPERDVGRKVMPPQQKKEQVVSLIAEVRRTHPDVGVNIQLKVIETKSSLTLRNCNI